MRSMVLYGTFVLGIFSFSMNVRAQGNVAATADAPRVTARVTVDVDHVPLAMVLHTIARQAGLVPIYEKALIPTTSRITLHVRDLTAEEAFQSVLSGTGLVARVKSEGYVAIVRGSSSGMTTGTVLGVVADAATKRPIAGARVTVDGGTPESHTSDDGAYRMANVPAGSHTITVRKLGYTTAKYTVTITDGATVMLDVRMSTSVNTLDQVVVTGTVIPTELKAVPNAITVITAKQIEERGITHIDQLFHGDVPGLFAPNQGTGATFGQVTMFSRGATALNESSLGGSANNSHALTNPIKTYVDGVELADSRYLLQIDPTSIERIEILTGPQASTIYGSNAINGVMQIFTKRGRSNTSQFTLNLQSGWVENNFSSAHTPQHDYRVQLNGIEGRVSYNAGGSWNYMGPWSPSAQAARVAAFGGARWELPTQLGRVSGDMSLRRTVSQNLVRGVPSQTIVAYSASGWSAPSVENNGVLAPVTGTVAGQTLGVSLSYVPAAWWSHEIGIGSDLTETENRRTARGYTSISDTSLFFIQSRADKRSLRYVTTARIPVSPLAQLTLTVGGDGWQSVSSFVRATNAQALTGTVTTSGYITRMPSHNAGGFLQSQVGIADALFLTYGLRAEWNPDYGADANPNLAPRVGAALAHDLETPFGPVTAKLRASYGRSTRPPVRGLKVGQTLADAYGTRWPENQNLYLPFYAEPLYQQLANPDLGPESQAGGEGGIELYLGTRASVVVTRYNQTVNDLIANAIVDSVRSSIPCRDASPPCDASSYDVDGYGYWPFFQNVNLGNIRNQGWELQGTGVLGPFTTHATYSWTKSRTLGVNPRYRGYFADAQQYPQYQPGASFTFLPEHTWALGTTYARGGSTIGINLMGTGQATTFESALGRKYYSARLFQNRPRLIPGWASKTNASYVLADLNASHRFSRLIDGVIDVHNLEDKYINDYDALYATMGRQVNAGLRIRTP